MFPTILVVDDESSIQQTLGGLLTDEGFEVLSASNGYEALKIIENESPDLVLMDIWMPGLDGIEILKEIRKENPHIPVIMITGHGTIETAVSATKYGAFDFFEKPLSIDKVIVGINNALNFRMLEEENRYLRKKTIEKHSIDGRSPKILELKKQIEAAAPADASILIKGEHGTGKELVARTIHQLSRRADKPMIDVNCAAIPEEFIEVELFGHEKGAIPGVPGKTRGKFELADQGTIFLDEIGDMNIKMQAKILRVLEERKFQRIGGSRILSVNVRVIAATNKNLEEEIALGNFREDLYYRLNVIPIHVPPLRERVEDLPILFDIFLTRYAQQYQCSKKKVRSDVFDLITRYHWPGNVREMKNLVERLIIMTPDEVLEPRHIPAPYNPGADSGAPASDPGFFAMENFKEARSAFEKEFFRTKLKQHGNDIAKAAASMGIDRRTLEKALKGE